MRLVTAQGVYGRPGAILSLACTVEAAWPPRCGSCSSCTDSGAREAPSASLPRHWLQFGLNSAVCNPFCNPTPHPPMPRRGTPQYEPGHERLPLRISDHDYVRTQKPFPYTRECGFDSHLRHHLSLNQARDPRLCSCWRHRSITHSSRRSYAEVTTDTG